MQATSTITFFMGAVALISAYPARKATSPEPARRAAAQIQCSSHDRMCLSKGQIPHSDGHCYTPLERGPCSKNQMIVLDVNDGSTLRGRCRVQECTSGLVFAEGRCLGLRTARAFLCSGRNLHLDATGSPLCGRFSGWIKGIREFVRCSDVKRKQFTPYSSSLAMNSSQVFNFTRRLKFGGTFPSTAEAVRTSNMLCAEQNNGDCVPVTLGDKPIPVIEAEK